MSPLLIDNFFLDLVLYAFFSASSSSKVEGLY